jgi:methyl-accepting chemotaxis protein
MQELNATFAIITESAGKLQELATNMSDTISYFKP